MNTTIRLTTLLVLGTFLFVSAPTSVAAGNLRAEVDYNTPTPYADIKEEAYYLIVGLGYSEEEALDELMWIYGDDPHAVALLLPAVQSAREAGRRSKPKSQTIDPVTDYTDGTEEDSTLAGEAKPLPYYRIMLSE